MKEFKYNVIQLIEGVKDRPCLWDKTTENYKDRVERRLAWEEIFAMLEEGYENMTPEEKRLTGEHILHKWTNIRDTFVKSLKTKMGRPKRRYLLYDHLKFLTKITPEQIVVEPTEFSNEANEEIPFMKQEADAEPQSPESSESYEPSTIEKNISKPNNFCAIESTYSQKKSKRNDFGELNSGEYYMSEESPTTRRKSKRIFSLDLNKDKKKKKRSMNDVESMSADIDFIEVDESDNPRVMNEDEAFFASLLPTVVKYSENERLEFRIEVLSVMRKIMDKRKWSNE
ncbi:uncharacterized protein LOC142983823 [Anticarsia gemmatalis]|uniref:uncharacterized protein LOC142983823 n=1 Tax=Anticarsia gemmatalis TaxID=129554 RepID=UPI003F769AAE